MATAREISEAAARRTRRALLAALVLLVASAAGTVWLLAGGGSSPRPAPGTELAGSGQRTAPAGGAPSVGSPPAVASAEPGEGFVAPLRWVRLPAPGGLAGDLPVRFGHTELGAVATAVAALVYGWTTDPLVWAAVARTYTVPAQAEQVAAQAELVTALTRQRYGLPDSGPLPAGAYLTVRPTGVQWQATSTDRVRVSVLAQVTSRAGDGLPERGWLTSITGDVVWLAEFGDWRMAPSAGALPTPPAARLGTAAFNTAGWVAIEEA